MMTTSYVEAHSIEDAIDALADEDSVAIAGGQAVVLLMNIGLAAPGRLISLRTIPGLGGVRLVDGELEIGALATHAMLARDPVVKSSLPGLASVFHSIGNPRVRSVGTIGGNLAHADPAQDPPVALAALGARVVVRGEHGRREIGVEELFEGPFETTLAPAELITHVRVPVVDGARFTYIKRSTTTAEDYAAVGVAAQVHVDASGRVMDARLALGAVGPTVIFGDHLTAALVGAGLEQDRLRAVETAVRDSVRPTSDRRGSADYKRELAGLLAVDAIRACAGPI